MTKEEMAKAYAEGFIEEYREIAYDAFLCGYDAKCSSEIPKDLEEAAEEYAKEHSFHPCDYDVTPYDCFKAGAKWDKEQMMEEAVEGTVMDFSSNRPRPQVDVLLDPDKYHTGDKVRIIIVKEDEK